MATTLDVTGLFDAFRSHLHSLGVFESVTTHEPKAAPGQGRRVAMWFSQYRPASSGLNESSAVIEFTIRLYNNMLKEPQDEIDPEVLTALDRVMNALHGDFTLGGLARNIDIRGSQGLALNARAGYIEQDGRLYRIVDITVPVVVNDLYQEIE